MMQIRTIRIPSLHRSPRTLANSPISVHVYTVLPIEPEPCSLPIASRNGCQAISHEAAYHRNEMIPPTVWKGDDPFAGIWPRVDRCQRRELRQVRELKVLFGKAIDYGLGLAFRHLR
jgi:hypothetical protein